MKKQGLRLFLGAACLLLLLGHGGRVWQLPFVSVLDAYFYDVRLRLTMPGGVDERVVIVDIDEKSLEQVGRWPWNRLRLAELARRLSDDYQVAVLGFDVVFAEADESSGLPVLDALAASQLKGNAAYQAALRAMRDSLDYDRQFADALRGRPVVLGYYFSGLTEAQRNGSLPPAVLAPEALAGRPVRPVSWQGYGANLPLFQAAAAGAGHFNPIVDDDGSARRVPLIVEFEGRHYEALALAVVRTLLGKSELRPGGAAGQAAIDWLDVLSGMGDLRIPVDENLAALVPYRGREGSFRYIPAVDVLQGQIPHEQLAGRIVLVGTTAPGLMDLRSTPVGAAYPGVEVHANLIAGMLGADIKETPRFAVRFEVLQLLLCGALLMLLLPRLSPIRASWLALFVLLAGIALNLSLWQFANLALPVATLVLCVLLLYSLNMSWGYFVQTRSKRQFAALFGQYVPPELVDVMANDPENYSMAGRNQELTVLFSDIRGFTGLSEGMAPRALAHLMNDYFGAMTDVIRQNRGTLDKYIGDAIMAFWGAPVDDAQNARHAVLTALAMQQRLRALDDDFRARGWPVLRAGTGINTGMMTVGDMGSRHRKAYTVMGDAVNLASRLEGITKEYGVDIVVGEATQAKVPDVVFRELDRVRVKGKDQPIAIFEPLGLAAEVAPAALAELALWHSALQSYRAAAWEEAGLKIYNLQQQAPHCRLYALYAERLAALRANPPAGPWDAVTNFQTK